VPASYNKETRLPNSTSVTTKSLSYDPDGKPYNKYLYINGTKWTDALYGDWIDWDEVEQLVTVTPYLNA